MTAIAARPQVVEIEAQVRPVRNGYLMVGVQVAVAATECSTQLIQHLLRRWNPESGLPEYSDNLRLPTAIDTAPPIALETKTPESAMIRIVSALDARAAAFVMFPLPRAAVLFARTAGSEFGTARGRAGALDHSTGLLVGYHARLGDSLRSGQTSMCWATAMLRVDRGFSPHLLILWLYSSRLRFQARL